tara:strand:+ start:1109 stop:3802 length:2694 start_codon:yes stop_codon:yes gene_type:complete
MSETEKLLYAFGSDQTDGNSSLTHLLGGKGANLAEMSNLGIPVPPGFTISTEVCVEYLETEEISKTLWASILNGIKRLEDLMKMEFGGGEKPLLLSVRSGARTSMPGMMDTVLNLGMNDQTVQAVAKQTNNARFAYDSYRRFIQMFGNVVLGIQSSHFEKKLEEMKLSRGVSEDVDLNENDLFELIAQYKNIVSENFGESFPDDPEQQLKLAIEAVFKSWNNERAFAYRRIYNIPDEWGTAVNVQCMVFGNMGDDCGTGVAFSRNPSTGEKKLYGEVLFNAQGEDVVAGVRTPEKITVLNDKMPDCYANFVKISEKLEKHYQDMQDMEFTIQNGNLFMLQTRNAKRTGVSAIRVAVEMVKEGLIDKEDALMKVDADLLDQLLFPMIDPNQKLDVVAEGLAASPGGAVGKIVFTAAAAEAQAGLGEKVVLVRQETSPEDIGGMKVSEGILTARGGLTSHAAVVARQMGKCCVAGCSSVDVREDEQVIEIDGKIFAAGEWISLDGNNGLVISGEKKLKMPDLENNQDYVQFMHWADEVRTLGVRANADTKEDSEAALKFGCEGIGLCRTEHMFFEGDRINYIRAMILANGAEERKKALDYLLPIQRGDFIEIFEIMKDRPVTIRLLDPPLHEFLPKTEKDIAETAQVLVKDVSMVAKSTEDHKEQNPMLGHRGCRLAITYPEISRMQVRAIIEAACHMKKQGVDVLAEIMIPLTSGVKEWEFNKDIAHEIAKEVMDEQKVKVHYLVGTMVEIPRTCLLAEEISKEAQFFSFGTNDLTQLTYGLSRDDAGKFLPEYLEKGLIAHDPFVAIDRDGVGEMVRIGVERGRKTRKNLEVGICGEHGGEPSSVEFCHTIKMDYVSCAPYRAPIARLAAAQATLTHGAYEKLGDHHIVGKQTNLTL